MTKKRKVVEPLTLEERNRRARAWLREHDLLNAAKLCRRFKYNRGAFSHFEEEDLDLGEEPMQRLEAVLAKYGYDPNLFHI